MAEVLRMNICGESSNEIKRKRKEKVGGERSNEKKDDFEKSGTAALQPSRRGGSADRQLLATRRNGKFRSSDSFCGRKNSVITRLRSFGDLSCLPLYIGQALDFPSLREVGEKSCIQTHSLPESHDGSCSLRSKQSIALGF